MANAFVNEEAEGAVLHTLLLKPSKQDVIAQLSKDDFHKPEHQKIFGAMQSLYLAKKEIDPVTLSAALREAYKDEEKSLTQIAAEIMTNFFDEWAIDSHVQILKSCATRRQVWKIIDGADKDLRDDAVETGAILEKVRQQLRDVVVQKHTWKSISDVLMDTFTALDSKQHGDEPAMMTGLSGLDGILEGFHPGEFTIIGARPAVGKSAFGGFIALSAAERGYKVGICSREMSSVQYGTRIIARGSRVDPKKLRNGSLDADDWVQISDAIHLYSRVNVSFIFTAKYVEDLRAEVQRRVDSGEMDMLVVDYIQLLQCKQRYDKDYLRIAYVSKMLKDMSMDFNIAVIGLAQVGRQSDGTMPSLAELRGSGDLEQDADNVIFLHRPSSEQDKYVHPADRALFPALKENGLQYIAIHVAKQRQGPIGTVATIFNPGRMLYTMIQRQPPRPQQPEPEDDEDSDE